MPGSDFTAALIWDVLWKTAFVLAILYGAMWALRRFSGRQLLARKGPSISVVETAHLGPGRAVHLVNVGNKIVLLGATSQHVSLLAELAAADLERPMDMVQQENRLFDRYLFQARELAASVSSRVKPKSSPSVPNAVESSEAKE